MFFDEYIKWFFQIMRFKILKAIHQAFFGHPITIINTWAMAHPKTFHKFSQSPSNICKVRVPNLEILASHSENP
jgi:hypothetical protein